MRFELHFNHLMCFSWRLVDINVMCSVSLVYLILLHSSHSCTLVFLFPVSFVVAALCSLAFSLE